MATYVKSQRGADKLAFGGYLYQKHRTNDDGITTWRCDKGRTDIKCPGRASCDDNGEVTVTTKHNHAPSALRVEAVHVTNNIRTTAAERRDGPRTLVNQGLAGARNEVIPILPQIGSMEHAVSRRRKRQGIQQNIPHTLAEVYFPDELRRTRTATQEDFVLHDSGAEDPDRIIILASNTDIARVARCSTWLADGTFRSAPEMLQILLDKIDANPDPRIANSRPDNITIDFEKAAEQSFRTKMPDANIHGCWFHLCQAHWRKIQDLGLAVRYGQEAAFEIALKKFSALAFCDIADIIIKIIYMYSIKQHSIFYIQQKM